MEQLTNLFDAFYSRFILRDLLAKITPGAIILLTLSQYQTEGLFSVTTLVNTLKDLSGWEWILLMSISWLLGMAIQGFGQPFPLGWWDKISLIRMIPKGLSRKDWYKLYFTEFLRGATSFEQQADERIVVVKEACGNGYLSILFFLIVETVKEWQYRGSLVSLFGDETLFTKPEAYLLIALVVGLIHFHFKHIKIQHEVIEELLEGRKKKPLQIVAQKDTLTVETSRRLDNA